MTACLRRAGAVGGAGLEEVEAQEKALVEEADKEEQWARELLASNKLSAAVARLGACIRLACSCCASGLHAPVVSLPVLVRRACPLVCCKQTLLPHATSALGTHRLYHRQREG